MNSLVIVGGRVIDPSQGLDLHADVWVKDGKIAAIGKNLDSALVRGATRIDAAGAVVCPGLIDLHVHLREPGQSAKETIATGSAAAARGGFTTIVAMPNTSPPIDSAGTVALIQSKAERESRVHLLIAGAISNGIAGEELAPIGSLKQAGVVAITDDGHCVQNNDLMRRALEYARMFDLPVFDHCQDYDLVSDGVMHEGYWSTLLGLRGWPAAGEDMIVARNLLLAELTGAHIHCQHISSAGSVRLIREAKQRGISVSGEACPHHFTLTDAAIAGSDPFWRKDGASIWPGIDPSATRPTWPAYDTRFKMNPPLRSAENRESVLNALADGTLEVLCSDHAPHCDYEKEVEFDYAPFGITGLENEFSLSLMQLYHSGRMKLIDVIRAYTSSPARILRIPKGTLREGAVADITVFDPDRAWTFRTDDTRSKSTNNPFYDWPLRGMPLITLVSGEIAHQETSLEPAANAATGA